jgi:hypothetical protein
MALFLDPGIDPALTRDTVSSIGTARETNLPETTTGMQHVYMLRHALTLDECRVKFLLGPVRVRRRARGEGLRKGT